jgi:hypothetical protein
MVKGSEFSLIPRLRLLESLPPLFHITSCFNAPSVIRTVPGRHFKFLELPFQEKIIYI